MGALNQQQRRVMIEAGFSPKEIRDLNDAKTPDGQPQDLRFDAPVFQRMIEARKVWQFDRIRELTAAGMKPEQIAQVLKGHVINFYRRNKDLTIFDFIKDEYKVEKKVAGIGISPAAMKGNRDRRSAISRHYGKDYGTFTPDETSRRKKPYRLPKRYTLGME
jgi:hypothetical protein